VLTGTVDPVKASLVYEFGVLLVVVAFLVANAVGGPTRRRISLLVVSAFDGPRSDWVTASFSPTP
jgi:hypothetical protein